MPIITKVDHEKQLTIHTATGAPSFEEGMEAFKSFYEKHPTKNLLWDLRSASLHNLSYRDMEFLVDYAKQHSEVRVAEGKTAIIVSKDLEYGISRMAQTLTEIKNFPFKVEIFRSIEIAIQWFDKDE